MKMKLFSLVTVVIVVSLCACASQDPAVALSTLRDAPREVQIGDRSFSVEGHAWRDYMPPISPDGESLLALVRIVAAGSEPFPEEIKADRIFVVDPDDNVWESGFSDESRPARPLNEVEKVARNGPRNNFANQVEIVVELEDELGNRFLVATGALAVDYPQ